MYFLFQLCVLSSKICEFTRLGLWVSFALNSTFANYFFVSIFLDQRSQLFVAKVLSVLYGIVMLIIVVVLVIEAIRL